MHNITDGENKDFYPTPQELVFKLFEKLNFNIKIGKLLEPSAGKGDLIKHYFDWVKRKRIWWKNVFMQLNLVRKMVIY